MQKLRGKIYIYLAAMLLLFFVILSNVCGASAFADVATSPRSGTVSDVLADLQKDTSFNAADYPAINNDYTLNVFQIAESTAGELLIYVYQPSGQAADLRATTVRISQGINDNAKSQDYGLTILSSSDVFYKYKVNGIEIKKDAVRYYDITAIHRRFHYFDEQTGNDNTIDEVAFEVGQLWTLCTIDGKVNYACENIETINVESKYVGRIRYSNGFKLYESACDSWLIAFSTDREIDNLFEADVTYYSQCYHKTTTLGFISSTSYEDKVYHLRETIHYDQTGENDGNGIGGVKHQWNRIERVEDFLKEENISEEYKINFINKTWVLRFVETPFTKIFAPYGGSGEEGTEITDVSILRLKFETEGKIYNLGVVDNKQTGTAILNQGGLPWWVWGLIAAGVIIFLCIISKTARKVVWFVIKVVTFPLWLPLWLIHRKRKERKQRREEKRQAKATIRRKDKPAESNSATPAAAPAQTKTTKKKAKPKERKNIAKLRPQKGKAKKDTPRGNN